MDDIKDNKEENKKSTVENEETQAKTEPEPRNINVKNTLPPNVMPPDTFIQTPTEMPQKIKMLIITEQGIKIDGFENLYEVLGFVDIHVDPERIKKSIIESVVSAKRNV